MEFITPKIYHVSATQALDGPLQDYLEDIGAGDFTTDAPSDAEKLPEVAGRHCYRSFKPGLNANVTKVREGNAGLPQEHPELQARQRVGARL